ncbi:MAG: rhomboid family intramembrane serine protease [Bacteroidota bacterium]
MEEITDAPQITKNTFQKFVPVFTVACCLVSIGLCIGFNLDRQPATWDTYKRWGAPDSIEIFNGSYWGLFTSNFLHTEWWHIAFNIYWFWLLGKKIEFENSRFFYAVLIFTSAWVSSVAQLSFGNSTGIGLSGIVYAFFGYIFIKSRTSETYKQFLDTRTINLFLSWLAIGVLLTRFKMISIGNAAHIAGLLWGMAMAYLSRFAAVKQVAIGLVLLVFFSSSVFWNPFSTSWYSYRAFQLHKDDKVDEAMIMYQKILDRDADNEFAGGNLKALKIYKQELEAVELTKQGYYDKARRIYNEILTLDRENKYAKEALEGLPKE